MRDKKNGAQFVCMEGADKLPNGYYGTCLPIDMVSDTERWLKNEKETTRE